MAVSKSYLVYGFDQAVSNQMKEVGIPVVGSLDDMLQAADIVIDSTPKKIASQNLPKNRLMGINFIVNGGENHETTGHSFSAEKHYETAIGRERTRVVSCNPTYLFRQFTAL